MNNANINTPIQHHLDDFNIYFRERMKSNVSLLDTVIRYILKSRGKQVRPALVFLSAELCGGISERTYVGASMVELLHTATLVHDDVVDQAEERRGFASINAVWKNKVAVLVGDFLLSRGLLTAVEHEEYQFLSITSNAVRRMSEGELLQIQKS
ncbi:MAG: polyprenyl synthetase family protein, partial [Candidatus Kapabacteria bacterium]|nr:polyprenyl synthetase family protein [Candidatus Kapabacteria bacterium]